MDKPIIPPSIGRVVWYYPDGKEYGNEQPHAALVAYVWDDRNVNLAAFDQNGNSYSVLEVRLLQGDEKARDDESHACWMPYQLGQAGKVLELAVGNKADEH
jgi:hypothetical protein